MKIALTGAFGFLGYHFRCRSLAQQNIQLIPISKAEFENQGRLVQLLQGVDAVVHFAGVNRGEETEVFRQNIEISKNLVIALEKNKSRTHVIFSSSTQALKETAYGKAKLECAELLKSWSLQSGSQFTEIILPHLFGEFGRPFYNSAVATFCYQLAKGEEPKIIQDAELELIHAGDVSEQIFSIMQSKQAGRVIVAGHKIKVSTLLEKLKSLSEIYKTHTIPFFQNSFELQLFNALRANLYPDFYPAVLNLKSDTRGTLFEAVKTKNGGQGFLSTTHPEITRGNHYHYNKIERFCVISGEATIRIRKLLSHEIKEFKVRGQQPCFIDIPTLHTHNITNTGTGELMTLFWSHEIFDERNPDTYAEMV